MVRAFAASAVVLEHVTKWPWGYAAASGAAGALWRFTNLSLGSWGVGLFFVLSGTCIHLPVARQLARGERPRLALGSYFRRRLYRIYPPHALIIFISWAVAAWVAVPPGFDQYLTVPTRTQFWAHVFMVHTFVPGATYSINAVLWTIAVESHFYLVYPLLLLLRRRFSMHTICAALFGLMLALRALDWVVPAGFRGVLTYSFLGRWWEWVAGAVIAERLARGPIRPVGRVMAIGSILLSLLAAKAIIRAPHGVLVLAVLGPFVYAWVIFVASSMQTPRVSWLDRSLVWVGLRSYSLYLTHPVALTLVVFFAADPRWPPLAQIAVALTASYLAMYVYFALVESRFLTGSTRAEVKLVLGSESSQGSEVQR